jgi:hypothetical protein
LEKALLFQLIIRVRATIERAKGRPLMVRGIRRGKGGKYAIAKTQPP